MNQKNDGGAAFPSRGPTGGIVEHGMSLRDYFAAKALPGLLSAIMVDECHNWLPSDFAQKAYLMADAMLEARKS